MVDNFIFKMMDLPKILGVKDARDSLSKMLKDVAENGVTYYIKGPQNRDAVLIGVDTFRKLQDSVRELVTELQSERETRRTLEDEIEAEASKESNKDLNIYSPTAPFVKRGRKVVARASNAIAASGSADLMPALGFTSAGDAVDSGSASANDVEATLQGMGVDYVSIRTPDERTRIVVDVVNIPEEKERQRENTYEHLVGSSRVS